MTAETVSEDQRLDAAIAELGEVVERGEKGRIFFNDLTGWLGLEIERDGKTITAAALGGQPISSTEAQRIENQLLRAKLYYDLAERRFIGQGLDSINRGRLADAITARANEMLAEPAVSDESNEPDDAP